MKLSKQVRSTHDRDGAVVLDIHRGQMFRANLVGSRILELLRHGYTESEITEKIAIEFCTEPQAIARDVQGFLAELRAFHLLEVSDETSLPSAFR